MGYLAHTRTKNISERENALHPLRKEGEIRANEL